MHGEGVRERVSQLGPWIWARPVLGRQLCGGRSTVRGGVVDEFFLPGRCTSNRRPSALGMSRPSITLSTKPPRW
eukprot:14891157-Alexandrium_andersonii.AAC.1